MEFIHALEFKLQILEHDEEFGEFGLENNWDMNNTIKRLPNGDIEVVKKMFALCVI